MRLFIVKRAVQALTFTLLSLCSVVAFAFPPQTIEFEQIGNAESIPDQVVTTLAEDTQGFIWIGTPAGVVRYDGYRFRLFTPDLKNDTSLAGSFVRSIFPTENGHLWVGTEPGGISIYDAVLDRFWQLDKSDAFLDIRSIGQLSVLAGDGSQTVYAGTSTGVFKIIWHGGSDFTITRLPLPSRIASVRALHLDAQGRLWIGGAHGLAVMPNVAESDDIQNVFTDHRVRSVQPLDLETGTSATHLLTAIEGAGVRVVVANSDEISYEPLPGILENETPYAFGQPRDGELWIAYSGGIVRVAIPSLSRLGEINHDPSNAYSLANNDTRAMLRDSAGQFWVAGYGGGVQKLHGSNSAVGTLRFSLSEPNALSEPNVSSVLELSNGDIWIGTRGDGINVFRRGQGVVARYNEENSPLEAGWITAMVEDSSGVIWVGANPNRLYRAELINNVPQFTAVTSTEGFWNTNVRVLKLDSDGQIWIGGSEGVAVWSPESKQMVRLRLPNGGLLEDTVNAIEIRRNGTVWVGTGSTGAYLKSPSEPALRPLLGETPNGINFSDLSVLGLLEDSEGRLWLDTPQGLLEISMSSSYAANARLVSEKFGFAGSPFGANMLEDARGRIWSTEFVYEPDEEDMWQLHRADDVDVGTAWYRSYGKTHDGVLMFGGSSGLLFIQPEAFDRWDYEPPVVATELRIDGRSVSLARIAEGLRLSVTERSFALEFSALDYSEPSRNKYRYRLDGFDSQWIDVDSTRRAASYSNLWPGNYTLVVEGTNRYGVWSTQQLIVPITVEAAFWQTPWFALCVAALVMLIFYGVMALRTRFMSQQAKELERVIEERTHALQVAQNDLIEREKMASLGALVAGVSHEINTPVGIAVTAASTLEEFTRRTIGKMQRGELTRSEFNQYGEHVSESTNLILSSLQRARTLISSFKQVAVDQSSEQPRRFLLKDFFEEVRHSLHPIYRKQKHQLIADCSAELEVETYPGALFQVLSNLVSNSTVHAFDAPEGEMRVSAEIQGNDVVVTYTDNGKGMPQEVLAKAFDPFFTTKRGTGGSGLGLHIVYNFVTQVLKGDIKLSSEPGKGMKAVIKFPRYL